VQVETFQHHRNRQESDNNDIHDLFSHLLYYKGFSILAALQSGAKERAEERK
jgi:hypothetical protein